MYLFGIFNIIKPTPVSTTLFSLYNTTPPAATYPPTLAWSLVNSALSIYNNSRLFYVPLQAVYIVAFATDDVTVLVQKSSSMGMGMGTGTRYNWSHSSHSYDGGAVAQQRIDGKSTHKIISLNAPMSRAAATAPNPSKLNGYMFVLPLAFSSSPTSLRTPSPAYTIIVPTNHFVHTLPLAVAGHCCCLLWSCRLCRLDWPPNLKALKSTPFSVVVVYYTLCLFLIFYVLSKNRVENKKNGTSHENRLV